jgi:hypothetical protein
VDPRRSMVADLSRSIAELGDPDDSIDVTGTLSIVPFTPSNT